MADFEGIDDDPKTENDVVESVGSTEPVPLTTTTATTATTVSDGDDGGVSLEGDSKTSGDQGTTHSESEGNAADDEDDDEQIEAWKRKVKEMEEEASKIREMQTAVEKEMSTQRQERKVDASEVDDRSIYVGQVDYSGTGEELQTHFQSCGSINRVTIVTDKYTGHPKGFAYIEFADKEAVPLALHLNDTLFKGRQIKVSAKRTNVPGFVRGGGYRGRGGRGGSFNFGRARGAFRGRRHFYHPYHNPYS